ncbi:PREDICTED: cleavage and polyadenylation specificity factor subunit 6-like [Camelina sativa]|uniref:Cleavage and polyadenylation specificity factor subunit 6-like n=1 Tax=Camelina sativa TaxID=90675 RepID=A0ABM1RIY7_CAMSA|nr:PREDICTED: cleavage and polyadenylation specificity factor subunit 6-like [Camelina sativa]XP_019098975.1 PREDICTED: cleavage and polyadenylation specificity factor subunit 6-like [Camelina sativa]
MTEDNVDYGGNQKILHQGSGTIPALADEELMGDDDEYDDLYSDVNVGESFYQAHNPPQPPPAQVGGTGNASLQAQNTTSVAAEPRMGIVSGGTVEGKYRNDGGHNGIISGPDTRSDVYPQASSFGAKGLNIDMQSNNKIVQQGSTSIVLNNHGFSGNAVNVPELPVHNSYGAVPQGAQQIPVSQMSVIPNVMVNKSPTQSFVVDNGNTMLFVGELHWWTTDAEIESILSQYGRVKEIKFFDERVSGKSKGYCQVEFYDSAAAAACKEGMNGYIFNGKACVVAFASPETLKQMGANFTGRNQGQNQIQNRRPMNEGMGRGNNNNNNNNNMNTQNGDGGRNYGRGGFARGGQGMSNRGGPWGGAMRGRGVNNMTSGSNAGPYGPGLAGPAFGGMMHPQGMMGAGGFDPTFMGRGGAYGGFSGLAYPGMPHSYPGVNAMGMVGIAPHVNPAFFGTGMGTMGSSGMNGVHAAAMWSEANGGGGEEGGSEYGGYEDETQEKEEKPSRDKERATSEREWSENSGDRRHKSHREEKDSHREYKQQRDRDSDEFDRGQSSMKSRSRSRMAEDDHRSRSRDADYGKRRRGD